MKKWLLAAAAAALFTAANAQAQGPGGPPPGAPGPIPGPVVGAYAGYGDGYGAGLSGPPGYVGTAYGHQGMAKTHKGTGKFWARKWFGGPKMSSSENLTMMPTLPVFMAAPWYNYWPYDGHFQTIAPMAHGVYYPPPMYTGNPYMTGQYPGYVPGNPNANYPMGPVGPRKQ
jgi:hypothetical protein